MQDFIDIARVAGFSKVRGERERGKKKEREEEDFSPPPLLPKSA